MLNLQPSSPAVLTLESASRELLARRQSRESLTEFIRYTLPTYEVAPHHRKIIGACEAVERGDCQNLIVEAPPRHGKSEIVSRRLPAWFVGRNPAKQIITATYAQDFASDFGREVRNIVGSEEFARVFPDVSLRPDSKAANRWHTNHNGIYVTAGVEGPITGRGADLAVVDDPFKDALEAESQRRRDVVWEWYRKVLLLRMMKRGRKIVTATRWHEDDLTGRIIEQAKKTGEQWEIIKLQGISPDGEALWPEWYSSDYLKMVRLTIGERAFAALYQQTPSAEDGTYFRREWFQRYTTPPEELVRYISIDAAISEEENADFTRFIEWGVNHYGDVFALRGFRAQKNPVDWVETLISWIASAQPIYLIYEASNIEKSALPWLKKRMQERNVFCAFYPLPSHHDKAVKARSFQAMQASNRIYWPESMPWSEDVIDELLRFPTGKHDDAVDCCGNMGRALAEMFAANPPKPKPATVVEAFNRMPTVGEMFRLPGGR